MNQIREIIERIVGFPRRENDGWREYNCPYCAAEKNVESDNKYNLAINLGEDGVSKPFFHCWRCETSGKISKLVRDFGNSEDLSQYISELKNLSESILYKMGEGSNTASDYINDIVELPKDFLKIKPNDKYANDAITYLKKRNVGWDLIDKFNIGYIPYWSKEVEMRNRIIIPSYDELGELNYYVARDFTEKRKYRKYNNPDVKKTLFVFNEKNINWYEDVTLVEGAFDHIVVPNSIPLLGKTLKRDYATYNAILKKLHANVNILLDDDAIEDAKKMYKLLNSAHLKDRVRLITCPEGYDASDIYRDFGKKGVVELIRSAKKLDDFELSNI